MERLPPVSGVPPGKIFQPQQSKSLNNHQEIVAFNNAPCSRTITLPSIPLPQSTQAEEDPTLSLIVGVGSASSSSSATTSPRTPPHSILRSVRAASLSTPVRNAEAQSVRDFTSTGAPIPYFGYISPAKSSVETPSPSPGQSSNQSSDQSPVQPPVESSIMANSIETFLPTKTIREVKNVHGDIVCSAKLEDMAIRVNDYFDPATCAALKLGEHAWVSWVGSNYHLPPYIYWDFVDQGIVARIQGMPLDWSTQKVVDWFHARLPKYGLICAMPTVVDVVSKKTWRWAIFENPANPSSLWEDVMSRSGNGGTQGTWLRELGESGKSNTGGYLQVEHLKSINDNRVFIWYIGAASDEFWIRRKQEVAGEIIKADEARKAEEARQVELTQARRAEVVRKVELARKEQAARDELQAILSEKALLEQASMTTTGQATSHQGFGERFNQSNSAFTSTEGLEQQFPLASFSALSISSAFTRQPPIAPPSKQAYGQAFSSHQQFYAPSQASQYGYGQGAGSGIASYTQAPQQATHAHPTSSPGVIGRPQASNIYEGDRSSLEGKTITQSSNFNQAGYFSQASTLQQVGDAGQFNVATGYNLKEYKIAIEPPTPNEGPAGTIDKGKRKVTPVLPQISPLLAGEEGFGGNTSARPNSPTQVSTWAKILGEASSPNEKNIDLHPERNLGHGRRLQSIGRIPSIDLTNVNDLGESLFEQMRVVFILNLPQNITLTDVSDAILEGPVCSIRFGVDAEEGTRYVGVIFQRAYHAENFYNILAKEKVYSTPGRFKFCVDVVRGEAFPANDTIKMMGGDPFPSRRLTLVKKSFFFIVGERQLRLICEKVVGAENIQLIFIYNGGNATIVFAEVEAAMKMKKFFDDKAEKESIWSGLAVTFSKDPCEVPLRLVSAQDN